MRFLQGLLVLVLLLVCFVFGMKLAFPLPQSNYAEKQQSLAPDWEGPLGLTVRAALEEHDGQSGVRPLSDGRDALAARVLLARLAKTSIDAQYYIWQDDTTGMILLDELRAAAERGVRVRLLVDDNGIPGLDALLAELDAMPTADVRIFNPFTLREPKLASYLFDFSRLNRRMHNKSMTVDGVATVVGGRNIGDIYFAYGEGTHYFDVDALALGPIVSDVSGAFDRYWNSASSYDADLILDPLPEGETEPAAPLIAAAGKTARGSSIGTGYMKEIAEGQLVKALQEGRPLGLEWGEAELIVDDPAKGLGNVAPEHKIVERLFDLVAGAETSADLVSAYFIPGDRGTELLTDLAEKGVRVRVLTNALESTDVMPVNAAYMKYRPALLESGVTLYELRAMREEHVKRSLPEVLSGSASGLHAKVFGLDGTRAFIGSFNLDPRSAQINTEMGLLIDSPTIAATLSEQLDKPSYAYHVTLDESGDLQWVSDPADGPAETFHSEPNTGLLKRALVRVISWLPVEWML
ncbi:phospholipase (plasmid) [Salipiger sp. CCB-MM3]|uniref:phospholipase D family protein n=1 Tax=Salipiger sp. CCB-MM3 TaxID=1792508 RepID=UPI00080AA267|nr:phospholipase D family protein [Salipiger sp. CCB-MM3]ANT63236.1 phospholipase [Salipiger sp. CCB-MM3]